MLEEKIINVENIMEELRCEISRRKYSREALDFNAFIHVDEVKPFFLEAFKEHIDEMKEFCSLNYEVPITGKGKIIKKFIRKLYRFHLRPIVEQQNEINLNITFLLSEVKNYMIQTESRERQREQVIEQLQAKCRGLEEQLCKPNSREEEL